MQQRLDHVSKLCKTLHIRPNASISKYLISHPPAPQYNKKTWRQQCFSPQTNAISCRCKYRYFNSVIDSIHSLIEFLENATKVGSRLQVMQNTAHPTQRYLKLFCCIGKCSKSELMKLKLSSSRIQKKKSCPSLNRWVIFSPKKPVLQKILLWFRELLRISVHCKRCRASTVIQTRILPWMFVLRSEVWIDLYIH